MTTSCRSDHSNPKPNPNPPDQLSARVLDGHPGSHGEHLGPVVVHLHLRHQEQHRRGRGVWGTRAAAAAAAAAAATAAAEAARLTKPNDTFLAVMFEKFSIQLSADAR